jgi:hypothetical protein
MKKTLLISLFVLFCINLDAQKKMYIFPPKVKEYYPTDVLKGKNIDLVITDHRLIAPGSKVKATFAQISDAIKKSVELTYGKEFINAESAIKVIIELKSYDVTFYTGMWHAQTRYIIKIGDKEEDIEQINRLYNVAGNASAKKVLNTCFTNINLKLFNYFNETLK